MHLMKSESPISQSSQSALKSWFLATRPKTWIASMSPVCMGTVMAPTISWLTFLLTLLFALLIQIGTNFANDYFDFVKGADSKERKGPKRAVNEGWISPTAMKKGTAIAFSIAALVASPLIVSSGLWSIGILIAAIACGILYTGGPKPLGYLGLGEVFVFLFFGPVAMCGAFFVQAGTLSTSVIVASLSPGLLSCSLIIANNLRDFETDRKANKKTLVVRFGKLFGQIELAFSLFVPLALPLFLIFSLEAPINLIGVFFLFPIAFRLIRLSFSEEEGLLQGTAFFFLFYTLLFCISFIW